MYYILSKDNPQVTENLIEHIRSLKLYKKMIVEIKEYRKNRTNAQNRLMWLWYTEICNHTGYTEAELHEKMKAAILGFEVVVVPAELNDGIELRYKRPKSTTDLPCLPDPEKPELKSMKEFLDAVDALARTMNIVLPYPDDYGYIMGYEK